MKKNKVIVWQVFIGAIGTLLSALKAGEITELLLYQVYGYVIGIALGFLFHFITKSKNENLGLLALYMIAISALGLLLSGLIMFYIKIGLIALIGQVIGNYLGFKFLDLRAIKKQ